MSISFKNRLKPRGGSRSLSDSILDHASHSLVEIWELMSRRERFMAVGRAVRDRLDETRLETSIRYRQADTKLAYYLSMEFLIGRALTNNLINLGLYDECRDVLGEMGQNLDELVEVEHDAALGNGGLGRLAACFLDSLATMHIPGYGYGINYEYGLFRQGIQDGRQIEQPDSWLTYGSPWLVERPEVSCHVHLYGRVIDERVNGSYQPKWVDYETVLGIPHDMPIVGYGGRTVNTLRLFAARAPHEFDMGVFNEGDFQNAVNEKVRCETICKVLYPNDSVEHGPELRLVQEYFLVACAVNNILRRFGRDGRSDFHELPARAAIQLNDTHPALAVAEIMRVLVDERHVPWDDAWKLTTSSLAYTNHTLMPEALEKWPVALMERVLPRHLQIIYEINRRFLDHVVQVAPGDHGMPARVSLITEGDTKYVRMAHLAIVGSHSVNGVAAVHSELVKTQLVPDFYALMPEKFNNKTNGVTPRRWLRECNPDLSKLLTEAVGDGWITNLAKLRALEPFAENANFRERFLAVKSKNKQALAKNLLDESKVAIDPDSMLDAQVKRIHQYKRQLLKVLHIVHAYLLAVEDGRRPLVPRTFVFAGKAAPSYHTAKEIIYLINTLGNMINNDPRTGGTLRVAFARDYRVTLAERIIPAADVSEQISTAGTEASGTSCMKFAMNGALTIGTLDGANIEIRDEVGLENIFIFGARVQEIAQMAAQGRHPTEFYHHSAVIRRIMDAFRDDRLSPDQPGRFNWVYQMLVENWDPYFHLADLESYIQTQDEVDRLYLDPHAWAHKAILNVARMGKFSSDRTIAEYARDIWNVAPVPPV
jgi:glycogen phosphorylase